jgi:hypothetical protein
MKFIKLVFMALVVAVSTPAFADDQSVNANGLDVLADVVLRPVGLVATIVGAGAYLSVLPAVAIHSIYPPHDAYEKWADMVVINPAKFTFTRPTGDYNYPQTEK